MNILEEIIVNKRKEVSLLRQNYTPASFSDAVFFNKETLNFQKRNDRLSVIAEIKKASPSKGIIKKDFDYFEIANVYYRNEVDVISVLTDQEYFQGSINFLHDIAKTSRVPLLRKDFIIDELQVFESKANGADLILLIAEILSAEQIKDLTQTAYETGLNVLLELHSAEQLEKIDFDLNKIIGINNRNLEDFTVSLDTTKEIANLISDKNIIISESGISSEADVRFVKKTGSAGILVGECLMTSKNIDEKISKLKEWCRYES